MISQKSEIRLKKEGVVPCLFLFSRLKKDFLSTGVPILRLAFSFLPCSKTPSAAQQILLCCTADLKMLRTRSFLPGIVGFFSRCSSKKEKKNRKSGKSKESGHFCSLVETKRAFLCLFSPFFEIEGAVLQVKTLHWGFYLSV